MTQTPNKLAPDSWVLADLLRGDFKQSQYGRIILPFNLLRRLECVLAPTKAAMLGDFLKAVDDAIFESSEAHQNQKFQLLSDPERAKGFAKMVFELLSRGS
ncbi:type I restriction-modification system subunit M N-terminal domain-containing protein [Simiduia curdlanivorans]|uniref:Type I restriction-modification system subunit M N-terminal domain-containing protein n=1 Tax=Simiduia curdlanivorans TaxID=1492769 RepID=A0ABV8V810_9GAMM|nr:type I restriction-modification system subunit M N-terminal domain-containing protein [Simiduia curdlanivorans]MDN3639630.1 type I restriction-modification system subunit M N-terminal domain-containing protein [Simiduia curdlanivorans]